MLGDIGGVKAAHAPGPDNAKVDHKALPLWSYWFRPIGVCTLVPPAPGFTRCADLASGAQFPCPTTVAVDEVDNLDVVALVYC